MKADIQFTAKILENLCLSCVTYERISCYPRSSPAGIDVLSNWGSCHKRQKPQAPTPQAPIRNRQMRKDANAKGLNRNTNLT